MAPLEPPSRARDESPELEPDEGGHRVRDGHPRSAGDRVRRQATREGVPHLLLARVEVRRSGRRSGPIDTEVVQEILGPRIIVAPSRIISSGVSASGLVTGPGHGEDLTSELERVIDGDPGAAPRLALHHHERSTRGRPRSGSSRGSAEDLPGRRAGIRSRACRTRRSTRGAPGCSPGRRHRSRSRARRSCGPPPGGRPRVRAASIPCAAPDTTTIPAATSARPRSCAIARPRSEHFLEPTIATRPMPSVERLPAEEETRGRIRQVQEPVVVLGIRRRDEPGADSPRRASRSRRGRSAAATRDRPRCRAARDEPTRRIAMRTPPPTPRRAGRAGGGPGAA